MAARKSAKGVRSMQNYERLEQLIHKRFPNPYLLGGFLQRMFIFKPKDAIRGNKRPRNFSKDESILTFTCNECRSKIHITKDIPNRKYVWQCTNKNCTIHEKYPNSIGGLVQSWDEISDTIDIAYAGIFYRACSVSMGPTPEDFMDLPPQDRYFAIMNRYMESGREDCEKYLVNYPEPYRKKDKDGNPYIPNKSHEEFHIQ